MKSNKYMTSACRYCRYFNPQGRRGGVCSTLNAPVRGSWKACSLAIPAFVPSWESLEDAWSLPVVVPALTVRNPECGTKITTFEETAQTSCEAETSQAILI
jgi:hypothetical protein